MTGFNSKRDAAADKLQEPVLDLDGHVVRDARKRVPKPKAQPAQEQHWNEDEWRRNNWRCGHGWLRGEQCESCNAPQPPSEWAGIKAILDEYGLQAIDFVADFKSALAQPAQEPYDQTALELCNVCGWKTLIPDDCCLNCERAQPAQEPDAYQSGYHDGKKTARARCIELVLSGTGEPVQTRTLEILQRDRKRIAKLIEEDGKP